MEGNDKISIVLIVDAGELEAFGDGFGARYGFKVAYKTAGYDAAMRAASGMERPVAVIRVREPDSIAPLTDRLNEKKIPYVCICRNAKEGFVMLARGAAEMMTRTDSEFAKEPQGMENVLAAKIKLAYAKYTDDASRSIKRDYGNYSKIIAIGSSTGGTETVLGILKSMPPDAPPILIVQHMPPVFTKLYAERMHGACALSVWEARDGDELKRGLVLLAPGDFQMTLERGTGGFRVRCEKGPLVSGHCPSVDVLFHSVAKEAGRDAIGVILTGMGKDGAQGLLAMRGAGAMTFGQDEATCVVYGMPREAYEIGAVAKQLPMGGIAAAVMDCVK